MRNPIRLKNLNARYGPFYLAGIAILLFVPPQTSYLVWGAPPVALGLALRGWGAGHLVKNDLLTVTGPYAYLRHPLYAGTILVATGFAILVGGLPGLALIAVIWPWFSFHYFPHKDRIESDRLEARYGEAYRTYRDAVPALWPRSVGWSMAEDSISLGEGRATWSFDRYSDNNELGTLIAVLAGLVLFWMRAGWVAP